MTEAERIAAREFGCRYVPAYSGRCNALFVRDGFCKHHYGIVCAVCGDQATHECSYCGQFVCGTRLCDDCEGYEDRDKASGAWGFLNHSHRQKPVERRSKNQSRKMEAADLGLAVRDVLKEMD